MFKKLNLLLIGLLSSSFIYTDEQEPLLNIRIQQPLKSESITPSNTLKSRFMALFRPKPSPDKAFIFVKNNDLKSLATYINNGGDINTKNQYGESILFRAILNRHNDIAQYLLTQPNLKIDQESAFIAVEGGYLEPICKFINGGGNVNTKDERNQSLFYNAIIYRHKDIIDYLLTQPSLNIDQDIAVEAARAGRLDVIHKFINNGGDVNTKNKYGESLLSIAIYRRHKDIIDYLLAQPNLKIDQESAFIAAQLGYLEIICKFIDAGEDVNTKNKHGQSLLSSTIIYRHKDIFDYLVAQPNLKIDQEIAMVAARKGRLDVIHKFINNGGDINTKNQFGDSLLTSAIYNHHKEIVDYLLAHSNINIDQKTAMEAAREGRLDIIHKFINNGGDMNTKNQFGSSLLSNAIACGNKDIVDYLLAQPSINIDQEIAPVAASQGYLDIIRKFINNNGNVNTKDVFGQSLLFIAIAYDKKDIVNYLLAQPDIDVNIENKYGYTPLSVANLHKDFIDKQLLNQSNKDSELLLEESKKYAEIIGLIKQKISAAQ